MTLYFVYYNVKYLLIFMLGFTHFDSKTYRENRDWCLKNNYEGCIYGSPIRISSSIDPDTTLYVLEMNNTTNRIMGIGVIVPGTRTITRAKIYSDQNYNRFIYNSKLRIDLENDFIPLSMIKKIVILEKMLFYGSRHCKRGQGIQLLPVWIRLTPANNILTGLQKYFRK